METFGIVVLQTNALRSRTCLNHEISVNGHFVAPAASPFSWFSLSSNGVSLKTVQNIPLLILLGDIGMGKTTTVQREVASLRQQLAGTGHAALYRDLKQRSESQILSQVFEHADFVRWVRGEQTLTLFLDSLDECWRRFDELESVLVGELEKRFAHRSEKAPKLFVRLTCRSAEWRKETGHALQSLLSSVYKDSPPQDILRSYALAPLSQENIVQAATCCGLDGKDLLKRIGEKYAQPLAVHPITFEMLLDIYSEQSDFPNTRRELFEQACERLSVEQHAGPSSTRGRFTTARQRVTIAERLAATSVFTNRNLLNLDAERPKCRLGVLEPGDIFGFYDEQVAGESVLVNQTTTVETLQSGLFTASGDALLQFRHPAYGDFLAARYLSRPAISLDQMVGLLADTSDNSLRLFPQLEETASWLADLRPELFERLLRTNADVFLRCEPKHLDHDQRALLVESFLNLIRNHEAVEVDWQFKDRFRRLNHPKLAAQLRKIISDKSEHPLVRETAMDIAHYCECRELAAVIAGVFLDPTDIFRLRKYAGFALESLADDSFRASLKQRASPEALEEPYDELKGYLLKMLWPSHLSVTELLALLTPPKKRNYIGSYRSLIENKLPETIPDADLPTLLRWFREKNIGFDIHGGYGHFPSKVLRRSLTLLKEQVVRDEIIAAIKSPNREMHGFFSAGFAEEECSAQTRREFIELAVESDVNLEEVILYGYVHPVHLFDSSDVPWFYTRLNAARDAKVRERWRQMIFEAFRPDDDDALAVVSELARSDEISAQSLAQRTSCPLLPEDKNRWKQRYFAEQKRNAIPKAPVPSFNDRIRNALHHFEQGQIRAFWHIIELLQTDPSEDRGFTSLHIQLSAGKAWQMTEPDLKQAILRAIPDYLQREQFTDEQVWVEGNTYYYSCASAGPAFVLLFDEARDELLRMPRELWQKWTPVLIAYRVRQNGTHDDAERFIYQRAAANAEEVFYTSVRRYLEAHLNNDHKRSVLGTVASAWSPRMKDMLRVFLDSKPISASAGDDLIGVLHEHDARETQDLLLALVASRNSSSAASPLAPTAAALLMTHAPAEHGREILDILFNEPAFGRAVVPRLVRGRHAAGWLLKFAPHDVAAFWDWLEANFPGDPYEEDDDGEIKARSVTISHDIFHFRRGVLETLLKNGTRAACSAMAELMRKRPQDFWLGDLLAQMRTAARRATWSPPHPRELMQMFADKERRLIRTAGDLHTLVVESIKRFEERLHGNPPSTELWNCPSDGKEKTWDPKDENDLSNCLKRHIESDLEKRGIIANREVQIARRFGDNAAEVVDLLVQATPIEENGAHGCPVSVIVEVKCTWNRGLFDDLEQQLYGRYLQRDFDFGIYLVAQFACPVWNRETDRRKSSVGTRIAIPQLQERLNDYAAKLSSPEKKVSAIVIDAGMR